MVFYNILLINLFLYICHFKYKFYFKFFLFIFIFIYKFARIFFLLGRIWYDLQWERQDWNSRAVKIIFSFFWGGLFIDFLPSFYALRLTNSNGYDFQFKQAEETALKLDLDRR